MDAPNVSDTTSRVRNVTAVMLLVIFVVVLGFIVYRLFGVKPT